MSQSPVKHPKNRLKQYEIAINELEQKLAKETRIGLRLLYNAEKNLLIDEYTALKIMYMTTSRHYS